MSKNLELAQDYFDRHATSNECFITSDGRVFHTPGTAEGFATTLQDNKVEKFTRDQVEKRNEPTAEDSNDESNEDQLILKLAELDSLELVKDNYQAIKKLVNYFEIEVTDQKTETLIQALTDYKLKIQE